MANVGLHYKAIVPKRDPFKTFPKRVQAATGELRNFLAEGVRYMQLYPPQVSASYRRTGRLGRGWTFKSPHKQGRDIVGRFGNRTRYAPLVQGPRKGARGKRQTALMRRYGWRSVDDVKKILWVRKYRRRIIDALHGRR